MCVATRLRPEESHRAATAATTSAQHELGPRQVNDLDERSVRDPEYPLTVREAALSWCQPAQTEYLWLESFRRRFKLKVEDGMTT